MSKKDSNSDPDKQNQDRDGKGNAFPENHSRRDHADQKSAQEMDQNDDEADAKLSDVNGPADKK